MSANISWTAAADAASYVVEYAVAPIGPWLTAATVLAPNTTYAHEAGTPATWYRVTSTDSLGVKGEPSYPFQPAGWVKSPLASVEDLKTYLSKSDYSDDPLLARLLGAASEWFEAKAGQHIRACEKVIRFMGRGERRYVLGGYPVLGVTSVTVGGELVTDYVLVNSTVHFTNYRVPKNSVVEISYTCGYPTVPGDVAQAIIELAALAFRDRNRIGLSSENIAGQSVSYLPSIIPAKVQSVVDSYSAVRF